MIDNQFDNFVNGKLGDHEVPVPAGLWEKVANGQFDNFIGNKLKDVEAPVPDGLWEKITDTQFDSFVNGKLVDYTAPVPAGLWEKVRPDKDNDRGGFAWFRSPGRAVALAMLLIGLLGGGYYWYSTTQNHPENNNNEQSLVPPSKTGSINNSSPTDSQNNPSQAPEASAQSPGEHETLPGEPLPAQKQPAEAVVGTLPASPSTNQMEKDVNADDPTSSLTVRSTRGARRNAGENVGVITPGFDLKNNAGRINGATVNRKNELVIDKDIAANHPDRNKAGSNKNVDTQTGLLADPVNEKDDFEFIEPYQPAHLQSGSTIPFSLTNQYGLVDKKLVAGNHTSQFRNVIICPADKGRNTDWFVEAYVSPDFAFRSLTNNTASQQYMLRKDSSESMRIGYSAGLRLVKPINENILVKAGVQFSQMNQKYVYRTENEIKTITVVSLRTIIRAPGDTVIVRDTSILQQIGFKNNTIINRFRSFDIPVTVGYQFGNDDLKIGINAGVVFNVSSWYQGVMLDSSLATVPITKGAANMVYKSNIGLGIYGGVSIVKRLSDDMHVFAEPYFRYNLSNMTTPNAAYNQKFSLGGISLGVRLNLNRQ